jgi:hypothetical protein
VALISREEAAGDEALESKLRDEFLHWETRSKCAPNGKWRGANSRKWGKVGIEMRLTGSVPRTNGPQTLLGKMVCKFVDIVQLAGNTAKGTVNLDEGASPGLLDGSQASLLCGSLSVLDMMKTSFFCFSVFVAVKLDKLPFFVHMMFWL